MYKLMQDNKLAKTSIFLKEKQNYNTKAETSRNLIKYSLS